jgi:hypothetical protein
MIALIGILLFAQGRDLQLMLIFMISFGVVGGLAEVVRQARLSRRSINPGA